VLLRLEGLAQARGQKPASIQITTTAPLPCKSPKIEQKPFVLNPTESYSEPYLLERAIDLPEAPPEDVSQGETTKPVPIVLPGQRPIPKLLERTSEVASSVSKAKCG